MIATKGKLPRFTPEEYFDWEEQQLERHEYIDGEVHAMSGGTTWQFYEKKRAKRE